jgi:hypothetical protein
VLVLYKFINENEPLKMSSRKSKNCKIIRRKNDFWGLVLAKAAGNRGACRKIWAMAIFINNIDEEKRQEDRNRGWIAGK